MGKEDGQQLIEKLRSNRSSLNELDNICKLYRNQSIPHNLDEGVLFQIELLHEKIGTILINLYMGDYEQGKTCNEITEEDYTEIIHSTFAKYQYMNS